MKLFKTAAMSSFFFAASDVRAEIISERALPSTALFLFASVARGVRRRHRRRRHRRAHVIILY